MLLVIDAFALRACGQKIGPCKVMSIGLFIVNHPHSLSGGYSCHFLVCHVGYGFQIVGHGLILGHGLESLIHGLYFKLLVFQLLQNYVYGLEFKL